MKLAKILCVVFTVISVLTGTADAAVTAWTTPVIATATGTGTITSPEGQTITIAATATTPVYAITAQTISGELVINNSTGVLSLASGSAFDFETKKIYQFTVTCTDGGSTGTATVTLSITDVNDAPTFAQTQYSATIPDGSTAGTALISVVASDEDSPAQTKTYSIDPANADWEIGASTGIITVKTARTLDQSTTGGYQLIVKAADNGSPAKTGTATVWVAVTTCSKASAVVVGTMTMILVVASMIV